MDLEVALGAFLVVNHLGSNEQLFDAALFHLVVRDQRVELGRGLVELVILAPERVNGRNGRHMHGLVGKRIVRLTALNRPSGIRNALAAVPAHLCRHVVVDNLGAVDARAQRPLDLAGDRVLAHKALRGDDLAPCPLRRAVDHRLIGFEVVVRIPQLAALFHDGLVCQLGQTFGQIADDFAFVCSNHMSCLLMHDGGYGVFPRPRRGAVPPWGSTAQARLTEREEICVILRRALRAQPDPA